VRSKLYRLSDSCFKVNVNNLRDVFDYKRFDNVKPIYEELGELGYTMAESSTVMRKVFYWFIKDLFNDMISNGIVFILPLLKNIGAKSIMYIDYDYSWNKKARKHTKIDYKHGFKFIMPVFKFDGQLKKTIKRKYCIFALGSYRKRLNKQVQSGFKYGIHQL